MSSEQADKKLDAVYLALKGAFDVIGVDNAKLSKDSIIYDDSYDPLLAQQQGHKMQLVVSREGIALWNLMGSGHGNKRIPSVRKFNDLKEYIAYISYIRIKDIEPEKKFKLDKLFGRPAGVSSYKNRAHGKLNRKIYRFLRSKEFKELSRQFES